MQVISTVSGLREALAPLRRAGKSVGLVPTMGYLHHGHMQLVARARADNDVVVTSLFVNPLQFGANEDLAKYPRDLERDSAMLRDGKVDFLFAPGVADMYPRKIETVDGVTSVYDYHYDLAGRLESVDRDGEQNNVYAYDLNGNRTEAFTALRKISGVVPSIMCMFGYNAGGGSYLPRQGSFMIQPADTFFGLTGPAVVKSALGEDVSPDDLGGPKVHGASGVSDLTVADEVAALRTAQRLLSYLPNSNRVAPPYERTSDPIDRPTRRAIS